MRGAQSRSPSSPQNRRWGRETEGQGPSKRPRNDPTRILSDNLHFLPTPTHRGGTRTAGPSSRAGGPFYVRYRRVARSRHGRRISGSRLPLGGSPFFRPWGGLGWFRRTHLPENPEPALSGPHSASERPKSRALRFRTSDPSRRPFLSP